MPDWVSECEPGHAQNVNWLIAQRPPIAHNGLKASTERSYQQERAEGSKEVQQMAGLIVGVIGLLIIGAFCVLAARAEEALWSKCRGNESRRQMQQQISLGKSRIR